MHYPHLTSNQRERKNLTWNYPTYSLASSFVLPLENSSGIAYLKVKFSCGRAQVRALFQRSYKREPVEYINFTASRLLYTSVSQSAQLLEAEWDSLKVNFHITKIYSLCNSQAIISKLFYSIKNK